MNEKTSPEPAHDELSPSSFGRAAACPGSVSLSRGMPDVESPEAAEGTRLHAEIARCVREADDPRGPDEDLVRKCLKFLGEWTDGVEEVHVELKMQLQWPWNGYKPMNGTADLVGVAKAKVVVIDWKMGFLEVPQQMVSYQLGLLGLAARQRFKRPVAECHVFAPRTDFHATAAYDGEDLALWDDLKRVYDQVYAEGMILRSGEHCQYCRAAASCPALARVVSQAMEGVDRFALAGAELAKAMDMAKLAEKWSSGVLHYGKSLLMKGDAVPGWILKRRAGNRHFNSLPMAFEKIKDVIQIEEFLGFCDAPILKLEELYIERVAAAGKITKKQAKEAFAKNLVGIIERATEQVILSKVKEDE